MATDRAKEGERRRAAKHREALAERGIKPVTLIVPQIIHPPLKVAAKRMREGEDPFSALRAAAGINEPPSVHTTEIEQALSQARDQLTTVMRERDSERTDRLAAEAARDFEREARQKAEKERDEACDERDNSRHQVGKLSTERDKALLEVGDLRKRARDAEGVIAKAQLPRGVIPTLARFLLGIPPPKPLKSKQKT